jgi:predicted nucleic acid-binding Zn ribbon protein
MNCDMKRKSRFHSVGDVLGKFLKGHGFDENLGVYRLFKEWENLVGDPASIHSSPDQINEGCLVVAVDNPVWSTEIGFRKKEILAGIKKLDDAPAVKDIRFRLKKFRFNASDSDKGEKY